jgi:hypothetical protein
MAAYEVSIAKWVKEVRTEAGELCERLRCAQAPTDCGDLDTSEENREDAYDALRALAQLPDPPTDVGNHTVTVTRNHCDCVIDTAREIVNDVRAVNEKLDEQKVMRAGFARQVHDVYLLLNEI